MSANVWFEEVNTGLLKELQNTVRIKNSNGYLVPLSNESFIVRKPEEDFKIEIFPAVSIYNQTYRFDPMRYNEDPVVMSKDAKSKIAVLEDPAIPFNLNYQIDFWSRFQTDMDDMTRTWLRSHFRQFNLNVVDDGGVKRSCNCLTKGSIVKSDLVLNGERLFHSITNLSIWVELDDEVRYNKYMITKTNVGVREQK